MKGSSSKLSIRKGSVNHIGTTPYKFKIDFFVSYIDKVKNAEDVCVTWERRGKMQATSAVKVQNGKAVVRETMSMESTLFQRNVKDKGKKSQTDKEQLKFDEKKVKFVLRKGGPDGKAISKIHMNIAEYVRGTSSTVFADLKMSNGSVIVSKIEANMLHMGKSVSKDSTRGSEAYSEMSESNSFETDSIFGEDEDVTGELEIPTAKAPPPKTQAEVASLKTTISPISSTSCSSAGSSQATKEPAPSSSLRKVSEHTSVPSPERQSTINETHSSKLPEEDLKQSPSLRQRLKSKIKEKTSGKKEKEDDVESCEHLASTRKMKSTRVPTNGAEVKELRHLVESLKEENAKLRRNKQAAMDEIDALRSDLEACENALAEATDGDDKNVGSFKGADVKSMNVKDRKIAELSAQNQHLMDELEERHQEDLQASAGEKGLRNTIRTLNKKIQDLEIALRREPRFLDVVNELKVTKVALALANMEKEQAIFEMQTLKQDLQVEDSE